MDPIIPALAVSAVLVYGYLVTRLRFRSWKRMAKRCEEQGPLHEVELSGWTWGWKLRGQMGPLKVQITTRIDKSNSQVAIVIPGPQEFSEVSIRREEETPWKTREIEVGSESFDKTFFITGPIGVVHALLDAEARGLLTKANNAFTIAGSRLEIAGGELLAEAVDGQLPFILPLLLKVGERFAQPMDVEQQWAHNATQDPEAGVRLNNLLLLVRELPEDPRTLKTLRAACSDRSLWVRLRAGRALGAEGHGVLLDLAANLDNDEVSAAAVAALDRELPFERTKDILFRALRKGRPQTALACLEALGRDGTEPAVKILVAVMEQQKGEAAVFAAQALGTTGNPAAEGPLIRTLQRAQGYLQLAAANALGRVGSVAAVLPLKELAERVSGDLELRQATRQAVAEIQSRLPGATPGQLSLAGAEVGQLSLAQADAGQLSLSTDPAGQLSLGEAGETDEEA